MYLNRRLRAGATAIEYALIAGTISVGIIVGITAFGQSISDLWFSISSTVVININ